MIADTAGFITKRYGREVAEAYTTLFAKSLRGDALTDDEQRLYDRFCVRISKTLHSGAN